MTITPEKYVRKPFEIDAVRVSKSNMEEVAGWCGGVIHFVDHAGVEKNKTAYIKVRVERALKENQTRAFVGDWVLKAGKGYKVYTHRAFEACFERVTPLDEKLDDIWQNKQEPLFEAPKECYGIGD
jgi:hypothetical protein